MVQLGGGCAALPPAPRNSAAPQKSAVPAPSAAPAHTASVDTKSAAPFAQAEVGDPRPAKPGEPPQPHVSPPTAPVEGSAAVATDPVAAPGLPKAARAQPGKATTAGKPGEPDREVVENLEFLMLMDLLGDYELYDEAP